MLLNFIDVDNFCCLLMMLILLLADVVNFCCCCCCYCLLCFSSPPRPLTFLSTHVFFLSPYPRPPFIPLPPDNLILPGFSPYLTCNFLLLIHTEVFSSPVSPPPIWSVSPPPYRATCFFPRAPHTSPLLPITTCFSLLPLPITLQFVLFLHSPHNLFLHHPLHNLILPPCLTIFFSPLTIFFPPFTVIFFPSPHTFRFIPVHLTIILFGK